MRALHVDPRYGRPDGDGEVSKPFLTIFAALAAAASQRSQPRPTLVLHSGTHTIDSPLHLGPEHSGISISALKQDKELPPPSISGGYLVKGPWALLNASTNVWRATTPAGLPSARQLFVDGRRANRTRLWWPVGQWDVNGSSLLGGGATSLLGLVQAEAGSLPELVCAVPTLGTLVAAAP